jgi:hypothetical protein
LDAKIVTLADTHLSDSSSEEPMARLMRSPIPKLLLFLVLTFVMAGVYELIWLNRPDYFRLQSGVTSCRSIWNASHSRTQGTRTRSPYPN